MAGKKLTNKPQHFRAALEKGDPSLGWTVARIPFKPADVWPETLRFRVHGTINGFAFRTALLPDAHLGTLILLVNEAMQRGAHVRLGDTADITLSPDLEPRPIDLPDELATLLDEAEGLRPFYDSLSEATRRQIGKDIATVKSEAAHLKRCELWAERLLNTLEAEQELPPLIANAFRARPKACTGWANMTATQRRGELMAVFYYRSPDSQAKRLAKLCDLAESKA